MPEHIAGLKETLKQVGYQNEMMLRWVNGAVITVDNDGNVIYANDVALQTLGWKEEEFIGQHMHGTIHHSQDDGNEYPWDFCPVFAALEDGSSHHVDGDVFWKKDGSSFSADYIVCPTRNQLNEVTGAILTFRNITSQRMEESKRIHRMKLIAIGELSAGIAHEINTPVQFIGSNVSFLGESFDDLFSLIEDYRSCLEKAADHPELADQIARIREKEEEVDLEYLQEEIPKAVDQTQNGVKQVTDLVRGLKGFAHSGNTGEKSLADVNTVIANSLLVCRNAYKYAAELETQLDELPMVKIFPGDIGQVVVNLVVNAAHAIEEKQSGSSELGLIRLRSYQEDDTVVIEVQDSGNGIPTAVRERIFDPFFTTKEVGRGSGQGLAICHTIIHEKHGGEISFTSELGRGTTFFVRIPMET